MNAATLLAEAAQSPLYPAGPQAARMANLFWLFVIVCTAVYILVFIATAIPALRRVPHAAPASPPDLHPNPKGESRRVYIVATCLAITTAILVLLTFSDFITGHQINAMTGPNPLQIKLTARQWWWEAEYQFPDAPSQNFFTANVLHIPTGRVVEIDLETRDVIHSFWVPNLHGKKDMIPNHPSQVYLRADTGGTYDGQCAEYCGLQHANMRLKVVAEDPATYEAWANQQRQPATQPTSPSAQRGQHVFLASTCIMCHAIEGTPARARMGPMLTHVASQPMLGAGALPNSRDTLRGWIQNPHDSKPGVRMPAHKLPPEDLEALLDYLQTLQ